MDIIYAYSTVHIQWTLDVEEGQSLSGYVGAWYMVGNEKKALNATITDGVLTATIEGKLRRGVYNLFVNIVNNGATTYDSEALNAFAVTDDEQDTLNPDGGDVTIEILQDDRKKGHAVPLEPEEEDLYEEKTPHIYVYSNVEIVWNLERELNVRPELRNYSVGFRCEVGDVVVERPCKLTGSEVTTNLKRPLKTGVYNCFLTFTASNGEKMLEMQVLCAFVGAETQSAVINPDGATVTLNLRSGRVVRAIVTPLVDPTDIVFLSDLFDTELTTHLPERGEALIYNGSVWESRNVAWEEIDNKPTWLTQQVPDLGIFGNQAGYIKSVNAQMIRTALGYNPLGSVTWEDVKNKPAWLTQQVPDLGIFGNQAGYIKLADINRTNIINALGYDPAQGVTSLYKLNDVDVAGASDGDALVYDGGRGIWVAKHVTAGAATGTDYLTKNEAKTTYLTIAEFNKWFYKYQLSSDEVQETTVVSGITYYVYIDEDWNIYFANIQTDGSVILYDDSLDELDNYDSVEALTADGYEAKMTLKKGEAICTDYDFFSKRGVAAYGAMQGVSGSGSGTGGASNFSDLEDVKTAQGAATNKVWGIKNITTSGAVYGWIDGGKTYTGDGTYISVNETTGKISFLKTLGTAAYQNTDAFAPKTHTHKASEITNVKLTLWGKEITSLTETWNGAIKFGNSHYIDAYGHVHIIGGEDDYWALASGASNTIIYAEYVSDSAHVGIGTTSPSERLHVNGNIRIGDAILAWDSTNNALKVYKAGTNDVINLFATGGVSAYGYGASNTNGSTVTWNQIYGSTGEKIAVITINGVPTSIYAPKGGGTTYELTRAKILDVLTDSDKAALISGITSTKVSNYDGHIGNTTIHVTSSDKDSWLVASDAMTGGTANGAVNVKFKKDDFTTKAGTKYIEWYGGSKWLNHAFGSLTANGNSYFKESLYIDEKKAINIATMAAVYDYKPNSDNTGRSLMFGHGFCDKGINTVYCGNTIAFAVNNNDTRTNVASISTIGNWGLGTNPDDANRLRVNGSVRIGDAILAYDASNNALKIYKKNGTTETACNLIALGGIAAYGAVGMTSNLADLQLSNSLTAKKILLGNAEITYATVNENDNLILKPTGIIKAEKDVEVTGSIKSSSYITATTTMYAEQGLRVGGNTGSTVQKIYMGTAPDTVGQSTNMYVIIGGVEYRLTMYRNK